MKCGICGREVYNIRIIYKEGKTIEGCTGCTNNSVTPLQGAFIQSANCSIPATAAHVNDIRHREYDHSTGKTYRNYNRKYFTFNSTFKGK